MLNRVELNKALIMVKFYAVKKGNKTGVFKTWDECKLHTDGYRGAVFKKFNTKQEAEKFVSDTEDEITSKQRVSKINNSTLEPDYYVYTDGSCLNNGNENAVAGIGIYFGENDKRNVSQKIVGKQTNNTAELGAILHLYDIIEQDILNGKKIVIVSDSEYAILCATTYGKKCEMKEWKKDIPNKEIVNKVYELYKDKTNVTFLHVPAHTGKTDLHSIGNDKADNLANKAVEEIKEEADDKIYLLVPYSQKEIIKINGGKWDSIRKRWYILGNNKNKEQILSTYELSD